MPQPGGAQDVIQALADEFAVRNLIARLSLNADSGDIDQYMSSFAPDAVWNVPGAPVRGRLHQREIFRSDGFAADEPAGGEVGIG